MKYFRDKFMYAINGLKKLFVDRSVVIQLVISGLTIGLFQFGLHASTMQMIIIIIVCASVVVTEMINSCIEQTLDFIEPNYNKKVKVIKDMSAGFVLFTSFIALVIGSLLLAEIIGG